MCRPSLTWGAIAAAAAGAQAHALIAKHYDCTLSANTRRACRTDRPIGRAAFIVGAAAFAAWFEYHIVTERVNASGL